MKKQYVTLTVNGREYRFSIGDTIPDPAKEAPAHRLQGVMQ